MKVLGFKQTLVVSVLVLVALCLTVANWFSYQQMKQSIIEEVDFTSMAIVSNEAAFIENWFAGKAQAIETLAEHYETVARTGNYVDIARFSRDSSELTAVFWGFDDGRAYSTMTGSAWVDGVAIPEQYDPRQRPWYALAQTTNGLGLTDVYPDSTTGNNVISIVKRVRDGAVLGDIELTILEQTVNAVDYPGAVTAILDESGKALASNSPALTMGTRFVDIGLPDVQRQMLANDEMMMPYVLSGVDKQAYTKAINLAGGKRWYLFIGVNTELAYAAVDEELSGAVLFSLLMIGASALVILLVLNRLYRPILSLKSMVGDLSAGDGDLTRRLPVTSQDDIGQISEGINQFVGNLQQMMLKVSDSSSHIAQSVERLKLQTENNNHILNDHMAETEQVVAAIEEMSATAEDVASNASNTAQFTQETNVKTAQSTELVGQATETVALLVNEVDSTSQRIADIGNETAEISSVLNVIGEIAEQTNLLALNAAIEAARAGDQGRGFAVVADEVRALAARTQASTTEIEATLEKLRLGASAAIEAMGVTKETCEKTAHTTGDVASDLDNIGASVTQINDLNAQIATAAEEQSAVTGEITRNMTTIREIVEKLATEGQTSASEANNLDAVNGQLVSVLGRFKLQ